MSTPERFTQRTEDQFEPEKGEEVFRGNFVRVTTEIRDDGRTYERVYIRNGVSIIPLTSEGNIRFIQEKDWDTGEIKTKLVSGYIHDDEDPQLCARRELMEEVGLTADTWNLLLESHSEEATVQKAQHYYVVEGLHQGQASPESSEHIESGYIDLTPAEVRERVLRGEFGSTSTAFALLKLVDQLSKK